MSESSTPTLRPSVESATARLPAVVDLPTPPLPLATAMICFTPGTPAGNVAVLSAIYVLGFLTGPLVIGGLAEFLGIRVGLMFLIPMLLLSLTLTGSLRPGDRKAA